MSNVNNKPVISAHSISKSYRMGASELNVLRNISFEIPRGQIVTIIGSSGVGKSTLLNIMGTLDSPSDGRMLIDGQDTAKLNEAELSSLRNGKIGFVFQFHHLLPEFSALENVAMPGWIAGVETGEILKRSTALLEEVGLAHRLHHKPGELSGGEQQRIAVARALINAPAVVLADEPTGNLDRENSEAIQKLVWRLCREKGQTMIIATHNAKIADGADRVIELFDGGIGKDEMNTAANG